MLKPLAAACLFLSLTVCGLPVRAVRAQDAAPPQLNKGNVKEVVRAMTVEEKARLLVGMGMELNIPGFVSVAPEDAAIPEKVAGAAGRTHAVPRLGIPSLTLADGPAGVRINPTRKGVPDRTFHATAFPVATLLASSWDTDLVRRVGVAFGREAREYGVDILLAPGLNLQRNPLGGRNFEYYSEDPLVSGRMAAAFVSGVQSQHVGTSIKHFAVNNQEFNRMQSDSVVSERALREIYLRGFEIAVKEGRPWTVMSAYNLVNGTYASQSRELLTDILRGEWGFGGFVMTDWFAGNNVVEQMKAGNEVLMPGNPAQTKAIVDAVNAGTLSRQQLDENVERVLNIVLRSLAFRGYKHSDQPDLAAHARVAREAAAEGMVLLRNEAGALPLAPSLKVALYGNASYDLFAGGTGSGDVNEAYTVSLEQGLTAAGYRTDPTLKEAYQRHLAEQKAKRPKPLLSFFLPPPLPEMTVGANDLARHADGADVALITVGRNSGEFADRKVEDDFTLSAAEQSLIKNVSGAFRARGKKVVVVMNVGGVTEVSSWRERADAILLAWQPGQEGGHAVADVLGGKVNPSGRLATTFPAAYADVPSAKSFPGRELVGAAPLVKNPFAGKPAEAVYEEGVYVGYRFYNTFNVRPAYEFGYGLSYTNFSYGDLKLSSNRLEGKVTVMLTLTNTGKAAGKEVVQLYVGAPAGKLDKPSAELRAFAKTGLIQPGRSQTLGFELTAAGLASFDPSASAWVAEAGTYTVKVGASSLDIKRTATLELGRDVVVEKVNRLLAPRVRIDELKPKRAGAATPRGSTR